VTPLRLTMTPRTIRGVLAMFFTMMLTSFGASCSRPAHAADELPQPAQDIPPVSGEAGPTTRQAVFAAGCFWCVEAVFDQFAGVSDVVSGYAGGTRDTADYEKVSTGATDHAEAVRITYDPSKVTYGQLLRVFFATHDPTTKDRQGPDRGRQYRSAVFYANDEERRVAEAYIKQLTDAKAFEAPIVTTLEPLGPDGFYSAEQYHQDFAAVNPTHPYIRAWSDEKVRKVQEKFPDQVKQPTTKPIP
jgi:peptide-methionine (S)-S-oxide reductase